MLTRLRIRNFKRFEDVDIELGRAVVLIGPNNSGKTTALQALTLWDIGLHKWLERRGSKAAPQKAPGVAINRRDLAAIPAPSANLLWRRLHVRDAEGAGAERRTRNVRVDVVVEGVSHGAQWSCGLEFDYTNEESFVCRPLREAGCEASPVGEAEFTTIPDEAADVRVAYLPPMSGLADREFIKQEGEIRVLIGQAQTAQVLRNLCHSVYTRNAPAWDAIVKRIKDLFGAELTPPEYVSERSEIIMAYKEDNARLDLSCAGRGLQQTLLLLAYLHANPGAVLLLDEPDAHLEVLRQRQILHILMEATEQQGSQVIAASHSEVVLNEAAEKGKVIAFVGRPHVLNDRGSQLAKSLTDIGWDQYYQAEQQGWVLYLEGPSDLEILRAFARTLDHEPALKALERPFVHYVAADIPQRCRDHFYGLREAKPDLIGVALFDRIGKPLQQNAPLLEMMWRRREIENYFCTEDVLIAYARERPDDLFTEGDADRREQAMRESIKEVVDALRTLGRPSQIPWSPDIKASDDFMEPVVRKFFEKLKLPVLLGKGEYYKLAALLPRDRILPEVTEKLDAIIAVKERVQAGRKIPNLDAGSDA